MRKLLAIILVLILCIVISGCTQQPVTPATSGTQTSTPATGAIPASLSSTRPAATLALDPGVILVSFHTSGAEKMQVNFGNAADMQGVRGGYDALYSFDTTGPFDGSLAFQVPQKDQYQLNITSTGGWTAEVTSFKPSAVLRVPVNLSGSGTQVSPFFYLDKGQYFFQRNETGWVSPQYYLWYANGSYVMDANNTYTQPGFGLDSPHPFVFINIPESGTYFVSTLSKNNPGNWSASISPVPSLPHMGPGPMITQWTGTPAPK
jgi:hypothetical protein